MPRKKVAADYSARLPERIFISHSYADTAACDALIAKLPGYASPMVWPRVEPNPREALSDGIVLAIRQCQGLIWLSGGDSSRSMWVAFERDYARRSGLLVLAYDPVSGTLWQDTGSPLPLRVEVLVSKEGLPRAKTLLDWMKSKRSFDFQEHPRHVRLKEIAGLVARLIHEQHLAVWLMDGHMGAVAQCALELEPEDLCHAYCRIPGAQNICDESDFVDYAAWLTRHSMYARLTPEWRRMEAGDAEERQWVLTEYPAEQAHHVDNWRKRSGRPRRADDGAGSWFVDLVSATDPQGFDWNCADDLIVQLTMMAINSEPFLAGQEDEE